MRRDGYFGEPSPKLRGIGIPRIKYSYTHTKPPPHFGDHFQMTMGKAWAGRAFGTHTGNLYIRFDTGENPLTGTLHFHETTYGTVVYDVRGEFNGTNVKLGGLPRTEKDGVVFGILNSDAVLNPKGEIEGEWRTDTGAAGTFLLFPHDRSQIAQIELKSPDQLHTARHPFGAIEIDREQIITLADSIQSIFPNSKVVVTVLCDTEQSRFLEDFKCAKFNSSTASVLKIHAQEPEFGGTNRVILIEFGSQYNVIMTQSADESWVLGRLEILKRELQSIERSYTTNFRKWGFGINQILLLWTIIYIPSLNSIGSRFIFVAGVVIIILSVARIHTRYLPMAAIHLSERPPSILERMRPSVVSWSVAVASGVATTLLSLYFQGWLHLSDVP